MRYAPSKLIKYSPWVSIMARILLMPYAYIIVPGKQTGKEMRVYQKAASIEILSNTANLQVVRNKDLGIWQMVFYKAGEFRNKDITVKADKGCVLMIKDINKREASFHIADPEQVQSIIKVTICIFQ